MGKIIFKICGYSKQKNIIKKLKAIASNKPDIASIDVTNVELIKFLKLVEAYSKEADGLEMKKFKFLE